MQYKKALLIDDDEVDTYISSRVIKTALFAETVITKYSSAEGLEYLINLVHAPDQLPEIIFLDLMMTGDDGFDFLNAFNLLDAVIKKNCRIIVLTNMAGPDEFRHESVRNNPSVLKFLSKPLTIESLQNI